jgi:transposase
VAADRDTRQHVGCLGCGTRVKVKGRRPTIVRDLPVAGRPTVLVWRKRRWRCPDADCATKTWSETSAAIQRRACLSDRARREACRLVGQDGRSVAEMARMFGVGWDTVMECVREHGRPLVDDPVRIGQVRQLGVDETTWLAATSTHSTIFATSLVDTGTRPADRRDRGPNTKILRDWLAGRPIDWLAAIGVVSIDPFHVYRLGLRPDLAQAWWWPTRFTSSAWPTGPPTRSAAAPNTT